ncbi:MAG: hypothetical protein PHG84_07490 [Endomicrobiaceae bacterium]|nr:hypothetical protein [Endomicrobiaceae bacterium]MDD4066793.1 hypothetical protein [Clostridia bacterium]
MINDFKKKFALIMIIEGLLMILSISTNHWGWLFLMTLAFIITRAYYQIKLRFMRDDLEEQKLKNLKEINENTKNNQL